MVDRLQEIFAVLIVGFGTTIALSLAILVIGTAVGLMFGLLRALNVPLLSPALGLYVHTIRGTPFLVQLFLVYFVLPQFYVPQMSPMTAGIIALSIYTAAYGTEITRAGLLAVPQSQVDAGKALGLNLVHRLWLVVLPQALQLMIPPIGGLYVVIVKSTSILSVIGITELVRTGEILALRLPQEMPLIYLCVAALYFAFCFPLLQFVRYAEHRIARSQERPDG